MTREEAIGHIKDVICENNTIKPNMVVFEQEKEALCMAIEALEQEPCEDAVSREAVIEITAETGALETQARVKALPPVTPKPTECEDAVSRQAMLDGLASIAKVKARSDAQKALMGRVMFFTEQLPPVTPKQRTGKWIQRHVIGGRNIEMTVCSECGEEFSYDAETGVSEYNFCPNCGAKMEGESE